VTQIQKRRKYSRDFAHNMAPLRIKAFRNRAMVTRRLDKLGQVRQFRATIEERVEELQSGMANGCRFCGKEFSMDNLRDLTLDHDVPLEKLGEDLIDNIVCACRRCNSRKGSKKTGAEFLTQLEMEAAA